MAPPRKEGAHESPCRGRSFQSSWTRSLVELFEKPRFELAVRRRIDDLTRRVGEIVVAVAFRFVLNLVLPCSCSRCMFPVCARASSRRVPRAMVESGVWPWIGGGGLKAVEMSAENRIVEVGNQQKEHLHHVGACD